MRADLEIIHDWIPAGSRVLDLGCGNGELLASLRDRKNVTGYGLEIDADNIAACVAKGVNVIEQDLDKGLGNFASNSFDVVVMTQALQAVEYPDRILDEMLRVGRRGVVLYEPTDHYVYTNFLQAFFRGMLQIINTLGVFKLFFGKEIKRHTYEDVGNYVY